MDISKNPITPKNYKNLDIIERLDMDNVRENLKQQNTTITDTTKWARIDEDELLRIFKVDEIPRKFTEEDLKEKVLETFNMTEDPLSVEALKKQFPNFPEEWYSYVSRSAIDKITLIKEEEQVKKNNGFFNIKFN